MNGLGRSVNEQLAFLAEAGQFECRHSTLSKVDGRRFLADYKETACVFAGAEENEKKRNR